MHVAQESFRFRFDGRHAKDLGLSIDVFLHAREENTLLRGACRSDKTDAARCMILTSERVESIAA